MKHFLRIIIVCVVLVALGFSCYFLFFKPDSDLATFSKLSATIDKRESLDIDGQLNTLYRLDGHGNKNISYHKMKLHTKYSGKDLITGATEGADLVIDNVGYDYVEKDFIKVASEEQIFMFKDGDTAKAGFGDICNYRDMLFKGGQPNVVSSANLYTYSDLSLYSYVAIERAVDDIFDYYFAYAQVMDNVKNSDQKVMNKYISDYNNALKDFNNNLSLVYNYQKQYNFNIIDGKEKVYSVESILYEDSNTYYKVKQYSLYDETTNASGRTELTNRYLKLISSYRSLLESKCKLVEELKTMVVKYVFGGEYILEADTVKMDLTLTIVKLSMGLEFNNTAISHLRNVTQFINIQNGKFANSIKDEVVLESYTKLKNNNNDGLMNALSLDYIALDNIATGSENIGQIKEQYKNDFKILLKAYGYGI